MGDRKTSAPRTLTVVMSGVVRWVVNVAHVGNDEDM